MKIEDLTGNDRSLMMAFARMGGFFSISDMEIIIYNKKTLEIISHNSKRWEIVNKIIRRGLGKIFLFHYQRVRGPCISCGQSINYTIFQKPRICRECGNKLISRNKEGQQ